MNTISKKIVLSLAIIGCGFHYYVHAHPKNALLLVTGGSIATAFFAVKLIRKVSNTIGCIDDHAGGSVISSVGTLVLNPMIVEAIGRSCFGMSTVNTSKLQLAVCLIGTGMGISSGLAIDFKLPGYSY